MKLTKFIFAILIIALIVSVYQFSMLIGIIETDISYSTFQKLDFKETPIETANITGNEVSFTILRDDRVYATYLPNDALSELTTGLKSQNVELTYNAPYSPGLTTLLLLSIVPVLILMIGISLIMHRKTQSGDNKGSGTDTIIEFGKAKGSWVNIENNNVRLSDVAISSSEYNEVIQLVDFLKEPERFSQAGGKIPKGFLMVGPPGVGKTLLAKALAGEAGCNFYEVSGSSFDGMLRGSGASRVQDLFAQARQHAPCIVFIDEIDAMARSRDSGIGNDGQTIGQLLTEMDGFNNRDGVIIIAATNRLDILDNAVIRPGRFDRQINISLPDLAGREKILDVHLTKINASPELSTAVIAKRTTYFSGAELANLVNESALTAASKGRSIVLLEDIEHARDKIIMGVENRGKMNDKEVEMTAYHEAGHVLVSLDMPEHDEVYKVSIIPRGSALGVTAYLPENDRFSRSREHLDGMICTLFGGRVAEEIVYGANRVSTGASNDIERATRIAERMVYEWGFSNIGVINITNNSPESLRDRAHHEVLNILDWNYQRALILLTDKRHLLDKMAKMLIEKETLTREEILAICEIDE